jgi:hypothetical protein
MKLAVLIGAHQIPNISSTSSEILMEEDANPGAHQQKMSILISIHLQLA